MDPVQGPSDNTSKRRTRKGIPNFPREIQAQKKRERDAARYQRKKLEKQQANDAVAHPSLQKNVTLQGYRAIAPKPSVGDTTTFPPSEPSERQPQLEATLRNVDPPTVAASRCRQRRGVGERDREGAIPNTPLADRSEDSLRGVNLTMETRNPHTLETEHVRVEARGLALECEGTALNPQSADRSEALLYHVEPTIMEVDDQEKRDTNSLSYHRHDLAEENVLPSVEIVSDLRRLIETGSLSHPDEDTMLRDGSVSPAMTAQRGRINRLSRSHEADSLPKSPDREVAKLRARVDQLENANRRLQATIDLLKQERSRETAEDDLEVPFAEKTHSPAQVDLLHRSSIVTTRPSVPYDENRSSAARESRQAYPSQDWQHEVCSASSQIATSTVLRPSILRRGYDDPPTGPLMSKGWRKPPMWGAPWLSDGAVWDSNRGTPWNHRYYYAWLGDEPWSVGDLDRDPEQDDRYIVERIWGPYSFDGVPHYRVHWHGYAEDTWEPVDWLREQIPDHLQELEEMFMNQQSI